MDKQVDILIGLKCNQKCIFCFQEDERILTKDSKPDMPDILKILIKGKKEGYNRVNIAGGEPTVYGELSDILKLSKKLGYKQIKIVTNGLKLNDINYAKEILPFIDDIAISFHSSEEETEDILCGAKGSYKLCLNAIKNIKKVKPNIQLINHTVITSLNFLSLESHIENIISLGFDRIDLLNMMPNTSLNRNLYVPAKDLSEKLISILKNYGNQIKIEICYAPPCLFEGYENYISGFDYNRDFLSNRKNALESWQETLMEYKTTSKKCESCGYYEICKGFWDEEKLKVNGIEIGVK